MQTMVIAAPNQLKCLSKTEYQSRPDTLSGPYCLGNISGGQLQLEVPQLNTVGLKQSWEPPWSQQQGFLQKQERRFTTRRKRISMPADGKRR
jgi:hypothetical protein